MVITETGTQFKSHPKCLTISSFEAQYHNYFMTEAPKILQANYMHMYSGHQSFQRLILSKKVLQDFLQPERDR